MLQINALPKMHVNTLCNAPVEPGDRALQRTSLHCHTLVHASFALLRMNLTIKLLNNLFSKAKRKREKSSKKKVVARSERPNPNPETLLDEEGIRTHTSSPTRGLLGARYRTA